MSDSPILHIYAQPHWHESAAIVGTKEELLRLAAMLTYAAEHEEDRFTCDEFVADDGEGYFVHVRRHEGGHIALPYTEAYAKEMRADVLPPITKEQWDLERWVINENVGGSDAND